MNNKEGTFFEESGHDSRGKFSMIFGRNFFPAVGGRTVWIHTVRMIPYRFGTEIEAFFGMVFEAIFRFLVAGFGPYGTVRTVDCGHEKRGTKESRQHYDFGTENEADFCGTVLVL